MKTQLTTALLALMLLTTACSKPKADVAPSAGNGATCTNCDGFVTGPTVFQGNLASSAGSRWDGLQVIADANSIATAGQSSSMPKTQGTYQAIATGGTFNAVSAACLPNGTYSVSSLQVGSVSPSLSVQAANPMWVTLSGPTTVRATMYFVAADSNGDDVADAGSRVYMFINCNGWTRVDLTAY
ncbi:hypothetical protein [Bdellovibrio sp. HCB337]|uniref:hypothetical protein n=1 Tax=Bdellovibrio sp. HCB337 TaxID=3394358 RepID=UPI0039A6CA71